MGDARVICDRHGKPPKILISSHMLDSSWCNRKRLYHRLMLASFICFLPLSVVLFIGTWAMPEVPWAVGEKGTTATCTVQAFFFLVFYLAFPFYYASLSIYACKRFVIMIIPPHLCNVMLLITHDFPSHLSYSYSCEE